MLKLWLTKKPLDRHKTVRPQRKRAKVASNIVVTQFATGGETPVALGQEADANELGMTMIKQAATDFRTQVRKARIGDMRSFRQDQDGGIIVMTILLLVVMLVMGGMAVDFMRYESQRAQLQSVSDRAVLAAAELDQALPADEVVKDFFHSAGMEEHIVGEPVINDTGNSRSVRVNSSIDVNTFYLRLVGIDELSAPAQSAAVEGIGKVEISLVLDISGSMRNGGSGSRGRFGDMQDAAKAFAEKVLDPENGGQISLNIVPYAGSTNPGPVIFDYINGVRYNDNYGTTTDPLDADAEESEVITQSNFPQVSSCVELTGTDWTTSGLPGNSRDQVPHFMNWAIAAEVMDWGWCPQDRSAIRYAMTDAADAAAFIDGIRMHDGTGTHYGMKWGLAALDPTTQPAFAYMSTVDVNGDAVFGDASMRSLGANQSVDTNAGGGTNANLNEPLVPPDFANRPAPWDDPDTRKILVLMTDGAITDQYRPKDYFDPRNLTSHLSSGRRTTLTSRSTNLSNFYKVCDMAKDPSRDVIVYTVALEIGNLSSTNLNSTEREMQNCASDPSFFFRTAGENLISVFEDIAEQITELRLSL